MNISHLTKPIAPASTSVAGHLAELALPALALAGLGAAYARTLAPSITWAHSGADSGDLAAAAATLGVAHPSGYPTYLLLARLFQLIPAGDLAFRANMLSAAAALLATLSVYALVRRLLGAGGWPAHAGAAAAMLALGIAPLFWSQAVIAEVYTLNALFAGLLLWQIAAPPPRDRLPIFGQGLVAGLALGNHLTIGLFVAAWLIGCWLKHAYKECRSYHQGAKAPRSWRLREIVIAAISFFKLWRAAAQGLGQFLIALGGVGAGLLVYLYLPLRAAAHPPVSWGGADTWAGFWWVVSGALYRPLAFGLPAAELGARLAGAGALFVQQFGGAGLALAAIGLCYGAPRARGWLWLSAGLALAQGTFALGYNTPDYAVHLIPALLIVAVWIGLGAAALLGALRARSERAAGLAAVLLAAALLWPAPATFAHVDASADTRALGYAQRELAAAPPRAIVLGAEDRDSFALTYARVALGQRPDTAVLIEPLLQFGWYRANMRAAYADLRIPETPTGDWRAALEQANPGRPALRAAAPDG